MRTGISCLHAAQSLSVLCIRFPSHEIGNPRGCHQISLVGTVQKHFPFESVSGQGGDGLDPFLFHLNSIFPVQPLVPEHLELVFLDPRFENLLRDMRFENPHRAAITIDRRGALASISVLFHVLPLPRFHALVVAPNTVVEVTGNSTNRFLSPTVRPPQTAAGKTSKVRIGRHDHHGLPHFLNLDGGTDRSRSSTVNHDVPLISFPARTLSSNLGNATKRTLRKICFSHNPLHPNS